MSKYKKLLVTAIEIVTFLLAAFSGFLGNIAPPDETGVSFPVGILSFLLLVILLIVAAVSRRAARPTGGQWLIVGVVCVVIALPAAIRYPEVRRRHTYTPQDQPEVRRVNADPEYLTPAAAEYARTHPSESEPAQLETNFPDGQVWTREGLEKAERKLLLTYLWLVLSLCTGIFCLLEANLARNPAPHPRSRP